VEKASPLQKREKKADPISKPAKKHWRSGTSKKNESLRRKMGITSASKREKEIKKGKSLRIRRTTGATLTMKRQSPGGGFSGNKNSSVRREKRERTTRADSSRKNKKPTECEFLHHSKAEGGSAPARPGQCTFQPTKTSPRGA